jgi:serine/threonine protein kinase
MHYQCGTPGFMAPEIISMRGKEHIDVACDIFSAGALLHVMLTNSYLFTGANSELVYQSNKILNFNLESDRYSKIDRCAMELLDSMLDLDFMDRISA